MGLQLDFAPLKPILLVQQFSQFSVPFTVCLSSLYFNGFSNRVLWGTQSMQVIFCVYFERTLMAAGRELNFSKKTWWAFCGIHIIRELWCLTSIFQNKLLCLSHCHNLNPVSCPLHHITWINITLCNTEIWSKAETAASFCNLIGFKSATDRLWPPLVAFMSSQRTWFQRQLSIESFLLYLHSASPPPRTMEETGSW